MKWFCTSAVRSLSFADCCNLMIDRLLKEVLVPPSLQCTRHWCCCEMEGKLMFLLKDDKKQQEFFIWLHGDYSITRHCKLVRRKNTFNLPEQDTTNTLFLIKHRKRWIGVFTNIPIDSPGLDLIEDMLHYNENKPVRYKHTVCWIGCEVLLWYQLLNWCKIGREELLYKVIILVLFAQKVLP